ncbi:hypothetical protein ElyMa_005648600 [Elysia marginata]|uniref:ELM2 domain-containing protein n=1 Tax=Elysia marginata TaxID=1093978 RepID=A0AAV4FC00_9GAST|nr:hypothetical protein ElyMa_005648600 [Elysia marginata]
MTLHQQQQQHLTTSVQNCQGEQQLHWPRYQGEREQQLHWPPCLPVLTGQACKLPSNPPTTTTTQSREPAACASNNQANNKGHDYQFRYDDGLSARMGVKRIPLVMRQHGKDGEFIFKPPPYPVDKPLRTEPKKQQPYWTPVKWSPDPKESQPVFRQHLGLFCDYTRCAPNETVIQNF